MRTKSEELSQFKSLTLELVSLSKIEDLSSESKKIIQDLTIDLRYQIEYSVMNKIINESESIREIIPTIEEMEEKIIKFKEEIYANFKESGKEVIDLTDRIKLLSMEKNLRRLNEIKNAIETKNINSYINAMNKQLSSSNDLVIVIKSILSDGYNEYFSNDLIKDGKVNENVMMIIYSIMKDNLLFKDLKNYVDKEHEISKLKADYSQDEKDLQMFYKCREYENDFKRYIILNTRMHEYNIFESELPPSIEELETKINNLSNQKYSRVFNAATIKKLETDLHKKKDRLNNIQKQKEELSNLEKKLISEGFEPVITSFKTEIGNINSIYDKFVIYIKTKMNTNLFDINGFIVGFKERMRKKRVEVVTQEKKLPLVMDNVSDLAKKLIENYHDDVEKIVNLYNIDEDMSKLIAFYVLNLLCSARKLDYSDLNEVYMSDENMGQTFKKMENYLNDDLAKINDEVQKVGENIESVIKMNG